MTDPNPYEYQHTDVGEAAEQEMFDHEARVRIADALHVSHFPIVCIAMLMGLIGVTIAALAFMGFVVSGRNFHWYHIREVVAPLIFFLTFAISFLCAANWLWSCAVTIDRARKRLSIASVAMAVEAQSVFWRKAGRLLLIVTVINILVIAGTNLISDW